MHTQQRFWQELFWVWFFKLLSTNHGFCCALFVFWKSGNYLFHLKHFLSRVWREGLPSDGIFPSFPPSLSSPAKFFPPTSRQNWFLKGATPRALDLGRCRNFPRCKTGASALTQMFTCCYHYCCDVNFIVFNFWFSEKQRASCGVKNKM